MLLIDVLGCFDYAVVVALVGVFVLRGVVHIHHLVPGAIHPHRCVFIVSIPGHTMVLRSWTTLWRVMPGAGRHPAPDVSRPWPPHRVS